MATCLTSFLNDIIVETDAGVGCGVLFLDLTKAFDTVDLQILEQKLQFFGFKLSAINWFKSYLSNRMQSTKVGKTVSGPRMVTCGVPQGSILGPLLFIIYVNDLPLHLNYTKPYLYADYTALIARGSSTEEIEMKLNHDLHIAKRWLDANKLSLNIAKTKVMLFSHPRNMKLSNQLLQIPTDDNPIEQVSNLKYLGLILDNHLSFTEHCETICKRVDQRTGLLWRIGILFQKVLPYIYISP